VATWSWSYLLLLVEVRLNHASTFEGVVNLVDAAEENHPFDALEGRPNPVGGEGTAIVFAGEETQNSLCDEVESGRDGGEERENEINPSGLLVVG